MNGIDNHDHHNLECMKLCIDSFQLLFDVDHSTEEETHWQAVFFFKDLRILKRENVDETVACAAKSIFRLLYTKADCVGIPAISLRITTDQNFYQLFTLELEEISSMPFILDDRAISHSFANLSQDLSQGSLHFILNHPQLKQMKKIILLLSNLFPKPEEPVPVEDGYCTLM